MKKSKIIVTTLILSTAMSITSLAGQWQQDTKGYWYENDDGSYPTNQWQEIDGKHYYFDLNGYMLHDTTTPDGYQVGSDGAWINNISKKIRAYVNNVKIDYYYYIPTLYVSDEEGQQWSITFDDNMTKSGFYCYGSADLIDINRDGVEEIIVDLVHVGNGDRLAVVFVYAITDNEIKLITEINDYNISEFDNRATKCSGAVVRNGKFYLMCSWIDKNNDYLTNDSMVEVEWKDGKLNPVKIEK